MGGTVWVLFLGPEVASNTCDRYPYQIQMFVPELIHAIVIIACHGPAVLRKTLHDLTSNLVGALHLARSEDHEAASALAVIQDELLTPDVLALFGLSHSAIPGGFEADVVQAMDHIASVSELVSLLNRLIEHAAMGQG
jgi:hypothetical protein